MSTGFANLNKGIELLLGGEYNEALGILDNIYIENKKIKETNAEFEDNFIALLCALGEIYMKKDDYEEAFFFYKEANNKTNSKDFNILFNLGIVNHKLNNIEIGNKFIDNAKAIEPNNEFLIKYLKGFNTN